ncbi:MAG: hypothetical protein KDK39_16630 [Leptospiraceae bacterium]|nr:hypothetical protein [Leptospiraceae bacterium]
MNFDNLKRMMIWNPRALWKLVQQCYWLMQRNRWTVIGVNLYFLLVVTAGHFIMIPVAMEISAHRRWQDVLLSLLSLPLTAFAGAGMIQYYLHLVRFQKSSLQQLLPGISRYFYNLLFLIAYYIVYLFLIKYILYIETELLLESLVARLQLFLGTLLFIFFLSRFLFTPAYIMDHDLSTKSGFKYSLLLTSGRGVKTFIVTLTFVLIIALGAAPVILVLLLWLWLNLGLWFLALLIPTVLLMAWSMGPGAIAYVRMYDLYQQSMPELKNLEAPPHPVLIRHANPDEEAAEEQIVKKTIQRRKRKARRENAKAPKKA